MKNLAQRFILLCLFVAFRGLIIAADIPNNTIYYTSFDRRSIVTPFKTNVFGANVISNTYNYGRGIIKFDGDVTSIGERAFYLCYSLSSITIPSSVTSIEKSAFNGCHNLTSISIPNSVISIGDYAFQSCTGLTSVTIPNSVTNIGVLAFNYCTGLTSVTIPNSITSIGDKAFLACTGLTSVTIPNSVTYIGSGVFAQCTGLTSITIPNSVTSIGIGAFSTCSGLTSITIPNSVTSIGSGAFGYCTGLTSITVEKGNSKYDSRNNCNAIIETSTNTLIACCRNTVIPNTVTSIGDYAFDGCTGLTSITIPNSVTSIGGSAFTGCSGLTSITIPNSVTSIGNEAFRACRNLTSVTIPNSVISMGAGVFYDCSGLTSITIPNSVTSIGGSAFTGCSGLTSVTNLSTIPQTISSSTFSEYGTLHVLPGCKTSYENAEYWKNFTIVEDAEIPHNTIYYTSSDGNIINPYNVDGFGANIVSNIYENGQGIITFDGDVTSIGVYAFSECRSLVSIKIPNSVTSIGDNAFDGCSSLMNTVIPNSVTNIGSLAFKNCPSIIDVIIPNSVKNIATPPFAFCPNIKSIKVDADNTVYDSRENCNAIINSSKNELIQGCVNTIIPKNVTKIGYGAFAGCEFTEMVIPNEVTDIGVDAFYGCKKLANIIIPRNVIFINCLSFYGCPELTNVTSLAATPPIFGSGEAFEYYGTLHVLPGCKTAYENAEYWNRFTIVEDAVDPSASIVLADGIPYNEETTQYNKDITYTRIFNNTSWQALYVPFAMSYEDWKDNFDVSYINGIRQYDKNEDGVIEETVMDVIMIKNGSLIPNTPYLIRAKTTGEKSITINNATLYKAEDNSIDCSTTIAKYTFTGTYTPIPASVLIENNYYAMGGGALVISNGSDLKPYRWYMQIDARSPLFSIKDAARRITINLVDEDDVVSGITEYTNTQQSASDSQIYDLNGRKVSKSALKSGLYIKNGKKVVIKTNTCE